MKKSQSIFCVAVFSNSEESFRLNTTVSFSRHHVHSKEFIIGSSKTADVSLTEKAIAPEHLRVTLEQGIIYVENLNPDSKTLVSGKILNHNVRFPYKAGEIIQIDGMERVLSIDLFSREVPIIQRKEELVEEADSYASSIRKNVNSKLKEAESLQVRAEKILKDAKTEAENIRVYMAKQQEEKLRNAIEEGHKRADAIVKGAELKASEVSAQLISSGKKEVEALIARANIEAQQVIDEGVSQKSRALEEHCQILREIEKCRKAIHDLTTERQRLQMAHEQDIIKKTDLETATIEVQKQFDEIALLRNSQKLELEKVESELAQNLIELQRAQEAEQKAREARIIEDNTLQDLKNQNDTLTSQLQNLQTACTQLSERLTQLQEKERLMLAEIRQKAEQEYEKQKRLEHARLVERLEWESNLQRIFQQQQARFDQERREIHIQQLSADIIQQLSSLTTTDSETLTALKDYVPKAVFKAVNDELAFRQVAISQLRMKYPKLGKPNQLKKWASVVSISAFIGAFSFYMLLSWVNDGSHRSISSVKKDTSLIEKIISRIARR